MPAQTTPSNRGPAAAAANRRALLAAARQLFARDGYQVPLSAIARQAGVGQGVLYRHFPTRLDLAVAVFDDNLRELEGLAAAGARLSTVWTRLVHLTVESAAFVEMVVAERDELPVSITTDRLVALLASPLDQARSNGEADPDWTVADLLLILSMVSGALTAADAGGDPSAVVNRALALIDERLLPRE